MNLCVVQVVVMVESVSELAKRKLELAPQAMMIAGFLGCWPRRHGEKKVYSVEFWRQGVVRRSGSNQVIDSVG